MKKDARQAKIEQIINQYSITTQDELMARLKVAGISVTPVSYTHLTLPTICSV